MNMKEKKLWPETLKSLNGVEEFQQFLNLKIFSFLVFWQILFERSVYLSKSTFGKK